MSLRLIILFSPDVGQKLSKRPNMGRSLVQHLIALIQIGAIGVPVAAAGRLMGNREWIGWLSSLILVLTMGKQVHKQWVEETSRGVSKWLFIGQVSAEVGFIIYSWSVKNWIFVFTNVALLLENIAGLVITLHHKKPNPAA
jgi:MtN3 and saliva related transmembrane protein